MKSKFLSFFEFPLTLRSNKPETTTAFDEWEQIGLVSEKFTPLLKELFWFFLDVTLRKCVRKNPCLKVLKFISSIVNLRSIVGVVVA